MLIVLVFEGEGGRRWSCPLPPSPNGLGEGGRGEVGEQRIGGLNEWVG